jgi:Spy/CpxP family protein refolding chaperone
MLHRRLLAFALTAVLVPAAALAAARPTPDQILHSPRLLAKYLQLTPDQIAKAQPLYKALGTTLKGLHTQEESLRQQLQTLLGGSIPSACDVGAVVLQIDGLRDQAKTALQTFDTAFSALLTPEQLVKYEALKDAAHIGDGT